MDPWTHGLRSPRVPHPRRNAVDGHEERVAQSLVATGLAEPVEQFHLHEVDGIDVGVADIDRSAQDRIVVQQLLAAGNSQHSGRGRRQPAAEVRAERMERHGLAAKRLHQLVERASEGARLVRDQSYLALDRGRLAPFERLPELRRAQPEDYALVYDSGARLRSEELDEDPRQADAGSYARRVEEECRDGYTHLWVDREGLCFRASVSAITGDAAQVAGVYTPPARRRRGYARRGLSELCVRLHERCATVCLFVNDFNFAAIDLYRALGFRHVADWGSAFYDRL